MEGADRWLTLALVAFVVALAAALLIPSDGDGPADLLFDADDELGDVRRVRAPREMAPNRKAPLGAKISREEVEAIQAADDTDDTDVE